MLRAISLATRRPDAHRVGERRVFMRSSIALLAIALVLASCTDDRPRVVTLRGATMGTSWMVKLVAVPDTDVPALRAAIEDELERVNDEMSTYRPDSEISRFSASDTTAPVPVSAGFARTLAVALDVAKRSGGALDPTVGPAVDLWGFGPSEKHERVPDDAAIAAARARIGWEGLAVTLAPPTIAKSRPELALDLSAVAKGHGVDRVCDVLAAAGIASSFVEIGGEVRVAGEKPDGTRWSVALERPREEGREVALVLPLQGGAVASSGDYRNLFREDGKRYSHTLDPRSARPVTHALAGVSVLAPTCAEADAWATALMVLGPDEGYDRAIEHDLAAVLFVRAEDGLVERRTPRFDELLDPR